MRRLLILFMILLLPLRGLAGDVMRVDMAASPASSVAEAQTPDCAMHGEAADEQGAASNCASCDLCVPLAELGTTRLELVTAASHVKPPMAGARFVSASPAPQLKPPIL